MKTKFLVLFLLLQSPTVLALSQEFRPRVMLSGQLSNQFSGDGSVLFGVVGAVDLRLGGLCIGAYFDYANNWQSIESQYWEDDNWDDYQYSNEVLITTVSAGARLGGYIYVNPHLALHPYAAAGYDHWLLEDAWDMRSRQTIRLASGIQFIIRTVGRFTVFLNPEFRSHHTQDERDFVFVANLGIGVGLGGD